MRKIAVIYSGNAPHHRTFNEPKYRQYIQELIYFPEFLNTSLESYDVLIVPSQLNEKLLLESKEKMNDFAQRGGIVVAFGPQPWEWIPNQKWEDRETNFWWWLEKGANSGLVLTSSEYDLFNYITLSDATWHQHGVFWPIKGTQKLITTEDGGAVLYVDKISTRGTWIVTTLDPDYHFGSYFMPATERFLDGFLPWLANGEI
ncbi:hypothetical protein SAMN05661091_5818 [Paenibacillus uliginis N3/975]|uniref:ThuA-like domain-containing protein n=1 Tax=Paenibacillus uliginis N3/975 TaxID=1313296 RepID=A0A1X7HUQ9_9BACL|nr:hypothetical protein [Paenibacillus uliginis]SMF92427.1 hypothetical protein SAMN05661091_5818 [Paenibacillus uliginis N3/975]